MIKWNQYKIIQQLIWEEKKVKIVLLSFLFLSQFSILIWINYPNYEQQKKYRVWSYVKVIFKTFELAQKLRKYLQMSKKINSPFSSFLILQKMKKRIKVCKKYEKKIA